MTVHSKNRVLLEAYRRQKTIVKLHPALQHYAWGGAEFLPGLLGAPNPDNRPFAEAWFGVHAKGTAIADLDGGQAPLGELLTDAPLPYLMKVLDAERMLSIQAHPTKEQAATGFARENAASIPLDAKRRNYKDANHKPEVHVALTEFAMLHGFRPLADIQRMLQETPEFRLWEARFSEDLAAAETEADQRNALRSLYTRIMTLPQTAIDAILNRLFKRLNAEAPAAGYATDDPAYWALLAGDQFPMPGGGRDRGIVSIFLMNLVHLQPGQGTFQAAGIPHAYLQGANVELMAASDNVLRGGLTPKHIDVPELLKTLTFESGAPEVLEGVSQPDGSKLYAAPASDFELSVIELDAETSFSVPTDRSGPDIIIVTEGQAEALSGDRSFVVQRGEAVFVPAEIGYDLQSASTAQIFRAGVPRGK